MQKRRFGNTGLETSLLGLGGFHLLEIHLDQAGRLLNRYLDLGGNYIETAEDYGDGHSEEKIGRAVSGRRKEYILATKSTRREGVSYLKSLDRSLKRLRTDHIDVHIIHGIGAIIPEGGSRFDDLERVLAPGGALEAAEEARKKGKIRFLGVSMHGQPDVLIESIRKYPFDAVMSTINYYDRFNFPGIEEVLVPEALEKDMAVILMKPVADGYLWRSAETAFKYALSRPVSVVVTGANNMEMLEQDIDYARQFEHLSSQEEENIYHDAPELGHYVCRQCGDCLPCPEGLDIPALFRIEGCYDRQMDDGHVGNTPDYALRERLKYWYGGQDIAREAYTEQDAGAHKCNGCGECIPRCPYGIDIIEKMGNIDFKLGSKKVF